MDKKGVYESPSFMKSEFQKEGRNGSTFHLPLGVEEKIPYTELKSSYWVKVRISLLHL